MTLCLFSQKKNVPLSDSLMKKGHTALKLPKSLISKIQMMPCVDFTYWLQLFVGRKEFQLCVGCCSATQDAGAKHDKLTPSFSLSNRCPRVTLLESPTWTVRANGPVSSFVQAGALTKCKLKQEGKKKLFFWAQDTCAAKSKVGGRENNLKQPAQMGDALLFPAEARSWQSPSLVQQAHCWRSWWSHSRGNVHSYLEERLESSAYQHVLKWSCFQVRNVKQWSYMRRERCSVSPGDGSQRAVL